MRIVYILITAPNRLYAILGAIVVAIILSCICSSCHNANKPEPTLYGTWEREDCADCYNSVITFMRNGEYYLNCDDNAIWAYEFIEPDSLILHPYVCYEERYKIIKLTSDSLIIRLSDSIIHLYNNGEEIEADYNGEKQPIYTFVRNKQ